MIGHNSFLVLIVLCMINQNLILTEAAHENKYSKEANQMKKKHDSGGHTSNDDVSKIKNFKDLTKPFRMNKLNTVWDKAIHKLSESKLKSLYGDLKLQDKEELKLKKFKSEGKDKDGLVEADIRRKLKGILNNYSLNNLFDEGITGKTDSDVHRSPADHENLIQKRLFKDKKLNRLWEKAEKSGFTEPELKALKEEFSHHQDKLEEYYTIMESLTAEEKNLMHNDIHDVNVVLEDSIDEGVDGEPVDPSKKKMDSKYNAIVGTHRQLKESYDKLHRKTVSGPGAMEFYEPRVQQLWKLAVDANFTAEELSSLHTEFKHYEKRLDKLNHIQAEYLLKSQFKEKSKGHGHETPHHNDKDTISVFEDKIKRHERVVEKLHAELEDKIRRRHSEL